MIIRLATEEDWLAVWGIFRAVVEPGDTYSFAPETTEAEARRLWFLPPVRVYVAVIENALVGTYILKSNQPGLGSHVANAGFMVAPQARGKGVGRAMGKHALEEAHRLGFLAMQFNFVVSTNERAIALWKSLGFEIVGTVPNAFHHRERGMVDIHIMYRSLVD
jgi:L-amino acid N-acyltransferase YncA